jgi:hypothetical protein
MLGKHGATMRDVFDFSRAAGSATALLLCAACSTVPMHSPAQTQPQSTLRMAERSPLLYVANFGANDVTVYKANEQNPAPIDTLTDGVVAPNALWIDAAGTLYVSNDWGANNPYADTVTEFAQGSRTPTKTLMGLSFPGAIAVDSNGTVYVQDSSSIEVYEGGSTTPTRAITGNGNGANAFAVDDHDNLYSLIMIFRGPNELCYSYVVKIPHGASGGKRIGVAAHGCGYGIALDSSENLYVAYFGNNNVSKIAVFKPGSKSPFRVIKTGVNAPWRIAFGPGGALFVPNDNSNNVTVYPAGGDTPKNTITQGVTNPFAVAISPPAPY